MATAYPMGFIGPIQKGDYYSSVVTQPIKQPNIVGGRILGASTSNIPANPATQATNNNNNNNNNNNEPSQEDLSRLISEQYDPYMKEIAGMESSLNQGKGEDEANLQSKYDLANTQNTQEGQNLLQDTTKEQNTFEKTIQSALSDAMRTYAAMQQQKQARFGGVSSAGNAIGELAQQEFFKQQGNIGSKLAEGTEAFGLEKSRIGQYVKSKSDELGQWMREAKTTLDKTFRDNLMAIQARKGDIEANKTRDKLALLQDAISRARQLKDQDTAMRKEIALAAVSQLQQVSGRVFTPAELNQYLTDYTNMGLGSSLPTNVGVTNTATASSNVGGYKSPTTDTLASLNPIATTGQPKTVTSEKSWLEQYGIPTGSTTNNGYSLGFGS